MFLHYVCSVIYRSVITCTLIYLDLLEMWEVEVMTSARCRVGTVPAIAAVARLGTHTHYCHLNGQASIEVVMIAHD